jgi:hypothetical protein
MASGGAKSSRLPARHGRTQDSAAQCGGCSLDTCVRPSGAALLADSSVVAEFEDQVDRAFLACACTQREAFRQVVEDRERAQCAGQAAFVGRRRSSAKCVCPASAVAAPAPPEPVCRTRPRPTVRPGRVCRQCRRTGPGRRAGPWPPAAVRRLQRRHWRPSGPAPARPASRLRAGPGSAYRRTRGSKAVPVTCTPTRCVSLGRIARMFREGLS